MSLIPVGVGVICSVGNGDKLGVFVDPRFEERLHAITKKIIAAATPGFTHPDPFLNFTTHLLSAVTTMFVTNITAQGCYLLIFLLEIGHQAGTHRDAFLREYFVVKAHPYAPDFVD
jgi:hypothetical protein